MEFKTVITQNWFTRPTNRYGMAALLVLVTALYVGCWAYFTDSLGAYQWMSATPHQVFIEHEWWRAWTTLMAHGDLAHLLANSFLLILFAGLLLSYFSWWFFPVVGVVAGGAANLVVLLTLDENVRLVGASGLVHWMGAAWATLYVLLENRQSWRFRSGVGLFLMLVLFTPDTYKPGVSYLAHFVGFVLGVASAWLYALVNHRQFQAAVKTETFFVPEWEFGRWDVPLEDQREAGPDGENEPKSLMSWSG